MDRARNSRHARDQQLTARIAGMAFLDAQARALLFEPPDTHEDALARYALTLKDVAFARRRRRSHNRLGFAVQLALVRDLGRPLRLGETIPGAVLDTVADQIGIDPVVFELYARRVETRREHLAEIMAQLNLRPMRERAYRMCIRASAIGAVATEKGEPIVLAVIDALKAARIVVPVAGIVERLALAGRATARRQPIVILSPISVQPPWKEHVEFTPITMFGADGAIHRFHFLLRHLGDRISLEAFETKGGDRAGHQFQIVDAADADLLELMRCLIDRIRRALAMRHIVDEDGDLSIAGTNVRGRVDCDLDSSPSMPILIIDGREVGWDQFGRMVMTFEGWQFNLTFHDPSEDV